MDVNDPKELHDQVASLTEQLTAWSKERLEAGEAGDERRLQWAFIGELTVQARLANVSHQWEIVAIKELDHWANELTDGIVELADLVAELEAKADAVDQGDGDVKGEIEAVRDQLDDIKSKLASQKKSEFVGEIVNGLASGTVGVVGAIATGMIPR